MLTNLCRIITLYMTNDSAGMHCFYLISQGKHMLWVLIRSAICFFFFFFFFVKKLDILHLELCKVWHCCHIIWERKTILTIQHVRSHLCIKKVAIYIIN